MMSSRHTFADTSIVTPPIIRSVTSSPVICQFSTPSDPNFQPSGPLGSSFPATTLLVSYQQVANSRFLTSSAVGGFAFGTGLAVNGTRPDNQAAAARRATAVIDSLREWMVIALPRTVRTFDQLPGGPFFFRGKAP